MGKFWATYKFWGVEVKAGQTLKVKPEDSRLIYISQASLGEVKNKEGPTYVPLRLKVDDKNWVLGSLAAEKKSHQLLDLFFEKEFELSHGWKDGSVHFIGYTAIRDTSSEEEKLVAYDLFHKTVPRDANKPVDAPDDLPVDAPDESSSDESSSDESSSDESSSDESSSGESSSDDSSSDESSSDDEDVPVDAPAESSSEDEDVPVAAPDVPVDAPGESSSGEKESSSDESGSEDEDVPVAAPENGHAEPNPVTSDAVNIDAGNDDTSDDVDDSDDDEDDESSREEEQELPQPSKKRAATLPKVPAPSKKAKVAKEQTGKNGKSATTYNFNFFS